MLGNVLGFRRIIAHKMKRFPLKHRFRKLPALNELPLGLYLKEIALKRYNLLAFKIGRYSWAALNKSPIFAIFIAMMINHGRSSVFFNAVQMGLEQLDAYRIADW